jgi:hypothetical protein
LNPELAELRQALAQMHAELKLLSAKTLSASACDANPWVSLKEAAVILQFKSARALKARIERGQFPPNCVQKIPSPSGKRYSYLVNVQRYLRQLN